MYPNSLKKLVSYWVPRKSMFQELRKSEDGILRLQAFIQEYLVEYLFQQEFLNVPLDEVLATYRKYLNIQLGEGNYDIDNQIFINSDISLFISAMPEGSKGKYGSSLYQSC